MRFMSKIEITGETKFSKERISKELDKLVKDRLHTLKQKIKEVVQDLEYYRRKYELSDENFLLAFANGELGDDEDYFLWKASVNVLQSLEEEQQVLQEVL